MAVPEYVVRSEYVGTGAVTDYTFDFHIESLEDLLIVRSQPDFTETFRCRGSDTTYLASVDFDPISGGGTVSLLTALPNLHNLALILADDDPVQPSEYRDKADFTLSRFEASLDRAASAIQRLAYLCKRSIKLPEVMLDASVDLFNTELPLPVADRLLGINSTADAIEYIDLTAAINAAVAAAITNLNAGAGNLPIGGAADSALLKVDATDGNAYWEPFVYAGGTSARGFGTIPALSGLKACMDWLLATLRLAPTISLSMAGGSGTVRERGVTVTDSMMTATVTKNADPIASVRFYRNGTLINTIAAPNPLGGAETYNETTDITQTTSFTAQVSDDGSTGGPSTVTSNTVTWTFLYPYYWGAGAPGKTPTQVAALTKVVATRPSALSFTANNNVFYLAYPATSAALSSIKDSLGFETINDWTYTTGNITGLDATAQSYRIYEFNNVVTPGTFPYTFS